MQEKFLELVKEALELENEVIDLQLRFREVKSWDSMAQLSLIASLDDQFGMTIPTEAFKSMQTLQEVFQYIQDHQG